MAEMGTILSTELTPGQYLCVKTRGPFGAVIRAVTKSQADHAIVHLGNGFIAEAAVYGCKVNALDQYRGQPMWVCGDRLNAVQRTMVCKAARSFAGREYNWVDIALIGLRRLGLRQGWLRKRLQDRDALICSELVCLAGLAAGLSSWLCGEPEPALVTPADLLNRPGCERVMWP